jgi:methyl-accepting chemotaxis protein
MLRITEIVSRTSTGAQESAEAAGDLSEHAADLRRIVGQFKV